MRELLEGKFLDQDNPYIGSMVDQLRTSYERSLPNIDARFAQAGRFGSGALGGAHALALSEFGRNEGALRGGLYESERDRMLQGLGFLSQENIGARGNLAQVRSSSIQAAAQRAAAAMQLRGVMANLGLQREQAQFGNLLSALGAAGNMQNIPYNLLSQAGQFALPLLSTFGSQRTRGTNVQPGLNQSPFGAGMSQGVGNFLQAWPMFNPGGGGGGALPGSAGFSGWGMGVGPGGVQFPGGGGAGGKG
jgi:hypothetical protein